MPHQSPTGGGGGGGGLTLIGAKVAEKTTGRTVPMSIQHSEFYLLFHIIFCHSGE